MPHRDHPNNLALNAVEEAVRSDDDFAVPQFGELRNRPARLWKALKAPQLCLGAAAKDTGRVGILLIVANGIKELLTP